MTIIATKRSYHQNSGCIIFCCRKFAEAYLSNNLISIDDILPQEREKEKMEYNETIKIFCKFIKKNGLVTKYGKITNIITFGCSEERDPNKDNFCTPCGSCRQRLNDFCSKDTVIIGVNETGDEVKKFMLEELLPHSFGAENL